MFFAVPATTQPTRHSNSEEMYTFFGPRRTSARGIGKKKLTPTLRPRISLMELHKIGILP